MANIKALDVGVNYVDNTRLWQFGIVAKNMGSQLKTYASEKEDIPFDFEFACSKKLSTMPVQFSVTIHHLHQLDIRYNDTLYQDASGSNTMKMILSHFIFAAQYLIGNKISISAGYNYLRRNELKLASARNGLNGFSLGIATLFNKLQVQYARTYYQNTTAYNQIGINFNLKRNKF